MLFSTSISPFTRRQMVQIHTYIHMQQYHAICLTIYLIFVILIQHQPPKLTASTTKSTTTLHWFGCNWEKFWFCHFPSHTPTHTCTLPHIALLKVKWWKTLWLSEPQRRKSRVTNRTREMRPTYRTMFIVIHTQSMFQILEIKYV